MEILVVGGALREAEDGPGVDVRETGLDFGLGLPKSDTSVPGPVDGGFDGWGGGVADFGGTRLLRWFAVLFDGVEAPDLPDM